MAISSRTVGVVAVLSIGAVAVISCQTWQVGRGYARWHERVKARIVEQVDAIARVEIARLNAANETYKNLLREELPAGRFGGFAAMYKWYEEHETYRLVDIQTSTSLFYPFRAIIEYEYVRYETAHRPVFTPMGVPLVNDLRAAAQEDTDFHSVGRMTRRFEYFFDADNQWNGEEGKLLW